MRASEVTAASTDAWEGSGAAVTAAPAPPPRWAAASCGRSSTPGSAAGESASPGGAPAAAVPAGAPPGQQTMPIGRMNG